MHPILSHALSLFGSRCCVSLLFLQLLPKIRRLHSQTLSSALLVPSDQLSHLNNCFDLLPFFFSPPGLVVAVVISFYCSSLITPCFRLFKNLFTFHSSLCRPTDHVCASVLISVFAHYLTRGSPSCGPSCSSLFPLAVRITAPPFLMPLPVCIIICLSSRSSK